MMGMEASSRIKVIPPEPEIAIIMLPVSSYGEKEVLHDIEFHNRIRIQMTGS